MTRRIRAVDAALRAWNLRRVELGGDLRAARLSAGLSQAAVGAAAGLSSSEVSRRELGQAPRASVLSIAEHAAAVGLKVVVSTYPVGGGVRDAAQLRYSERFLARVASTFERELEAVIPISGDLRAIDVILRAPGTLIAVEVITRLVDLQAQLRAARLKARDIGATRLIIGVAATAANRRVLAGARDLLVTSWELESRHVFGSLAAGQAPARDAIVLI